MRVLGYFVYMKTIENMGIFCVNGYFIVYLNDLYISERFVYVDTLWHAWIF